MEGETENHPVTLKQNAKLMVTFLVRFSLISLCSNFTFSCISQSPFFSHFGEKFLKDASTCFFTQNLALCIRCYVNGKDNVFYSMEASVKIYQQNRINICSTRAKSLTGGYSYMWETKINFNLL